jgi:hypothetical protein
LKLVTAAPSDVKLHLAAVGQKQKPVLVEVQPFVGVLGFDTDERGLTRQ